MTNMAKPTTMSEALTTRKYACPPSGTFSPDIYQGTNGSAFPGKRLKRNSPSENSLFPSGSTNGGPTKTRRVDPERLAQRLGPEIVQAMEALILPGNRMPTFAIRKELQERFNVDRRHVYDYFHSRGLRVAKEDKHTNLSRRRSEPHSSQSSPELFSSLSSPSIEVNISLECSGRPTPEHVLSQPVAVSNGPPKSQTLVNAFQPPIDDQEEEILPLSPIEIVDDALFMARPIDDVSQSSDDDHIKTVSDPELEYFDLQTYSDQISGDSESCVASSTPHSCSNGILIPVYDQQPLSKAERVEFYNLVNNSIGPAKGIAESAGSYRVYMKERSQLYFKRLFPGSRKSAYNSKSAYPAPSGLRSQPRISQLGVDSMADVPRDDVNFQKWLLTATSSIDTYAGSELPPDYSFFSQDHWVHDPLNSSTCALPSPSAMDHSHIVVLSSPDELFPGPSYIPDYTSPMDLPVPTSDHVSIIDPKRAESSADEKRPQQITSCFAESPNLNPASPAQPGYWRLNNETHPLLLPPSSSLTKTPKPIYSPSIFVQKHSNLQQPAPYLPMDTSNASEFSITYSPSNNRPRTVKPKPSVRPARPRTVSAGGGI